MMEKFKQKVRELYEILFPNFPFHIAPDGKRREVYNWNQIFQLINTWNGYKRLYYSLYSLPHRIVLVNKIFFDFDGLDKWEEVKRIHFQLKQDNIKHLVLFSGGGFHLYIFTNPKWLAKEQLYYNQLKLIEKYDMKGVDEKVLGDVARLAAIPYTYNVKRKRFVIPLKEECFELSVDEIKELTTQQIHDWEMFGSVLVDLEEKSYVEKVELKEVYVDWEYKGDDEFIKQMPPCIQLALTNYDYGDYRGRFLITTYLKDIGFSKERIDEVMKKYFSNQKPKSGRGSRYDEWKRYRILHYVFKHNYIFPQCERIIAEGRCPKKCPLFDVRKKS
jgi:hypothetical protein